MPTLIYSPGIRVVIETAREGLIDVSEDISRGDLTITENSLAVLNLTLLNHRRKYDGIFTPNDLVSVKMRRLRWMPVFAGYLDEVPYYSVYPRNIVIKATDTLKRLKYRLWDPGTTPSMEILQHVPGTESNSDGGFRERIIRLMTEVGDWPRQNIHIANIPPGWNNKMEPLRQKMALEFNPMLTEPTASQVGAVGAVGGASPLDGGTTTAPGTAIGLPVTRGKAAQFESADSPRWALSMRWPYRLSDGTAIVGPVNRPELTETWWEGQKILVVNPANNQAVVVKPRFWGPQPSSGRDIGLSEHALKTVLGAKPGDTLEARFAPANLDFGPVAASGSGGLTAAPTSTAPTATTTPAVVQAASGTRWTSADSLKPHTAAARTFVKANWEIPHGIGGYANRNVGGSSKKSDHATGRALDVMVAKPGTRATGADEAKGNAIAMWFVQNPKVFGTKYVIWMDRINSGSGWRAYRHPTGGSGNTVQHRDHVHISFDNSDKTSPGPMGSGFPGGTPADFGNNVTAGNGASPGAGGEAPLLSNWNWYPVTQRASHLLWGPRALMNDQPLLTTVKVLCQASMRSWMAAPNGDFIAWFPDYFGAYKVAAKMTITDLELATEAFTINWNDERLVTHQFTAGSLGARSAGSEPIFGADASVDINRMMQTMGIATVESKELMSALFNINDGDERAAYFLDSEAILQRFGARVSYEPMGNISGPEAEFWYAVYLFQQNWAAQFSSKVNLTFMPEVWPGMLLQLESLGFQAYVESVTHSFDFSDTGGGFSTSVRVIAPSASDDSGLLALPRAGGIKIEPASSGAGKSTHTYGWGKWRPPGWGS